MVVVRGKSKARIAIVEDVEAEEVTFEDVREEAKVEAIRTANSDRQNGGEGCSDIVVDHPIWDNSLPLQYWGQGFSFAVDEQEKVKGLKRALEQSTKDNNELKKKIMKLETNFFWERMFK